MVRIVRSKWPCCVAAIFAIATLSSCGGGGGTPATNAPDASAPLVLNAGNAFAATTHTLRSLEDLLEMGMHATEEVTRLAQHGAPELQRACDGSGSANVKLSDRDGDGRPTAGDHVVIVYSNCTIAMLSAEFGGTIDIQLDAVDDAMHGSVTGMLSFGDGMASADAATGRWRGALAFQRQVSPLSDRLNVSAAAAHGLQRIFRSGAGVTAADQADTYAAVSLQRWLRRELARGSVSGTMKLASERLSGSIDIATSPSLDGNLSARADVGSVRLIGASNGSVVAAADPAGGDVITVDVDSDGDGRSDGKTALLWTSTVSGFLWSERNSITYSYQAIDPNVIGLLSAPESNQFVGADISWPLRLQFDQPLVPDANIYIELIESSTDLVLQPETSFQLDATTRIIQTDVEFHGAVALIRPRSALRYGMNYGVTLYSLDALGKRQPVTLRSAIGTAKRTLTFVDGFTSDYRLWTGVRGAGYRSVATPDRNVLIEAWVPEATSLPLRYSWTQVSGPSLILGTPAAATTTVRLAPAAAPGVGSALLQLTVVDAIGRQQIVPVEVQVANLAGIRNSLYYVRQSRDGSGPERMRIFSGESGAFSTFTNLGHLTASYEVVPRRDVWFRLDLTDAAGGIPAVGQYLGAMRLIGSAGTGVPRMEVGGSELVACNELAGSFQVHELELDGTGQVVRLAVDFEQACLLFNGQLDPPVRGAMRINSTWPVAF
jgi:hypothetical protein